MRKPRWYDGGEYVPTVAATALSLLAAPMVGVGVLALAFSAWVPGMIFVVTGAVMWLTGRYLLDR